jgi:molecular chaperone DnaK (HSP70)
MRLGIDFGTTRTVVASADRGNYPVVGFEAPDGGAYDWVPSLLAVKDEVCVYGWDAWAKQQEPDWTVVRSLKRVLEDAGPRTVIDLGEARIPLIALLAGMAASLRDLLRHRSNLSLSAGEKLEVVLGVPANAHGNQRFLTVEAFRGAGFDVLGLLNEPSAASLEFSHKNKLTGRVLVYDLGGGTFDASLVEVGAHAHSVVASEGIPSLGGDDFDHILASMALDAAGIAGGIGEFSQAELFRLHDECRVKKEALHPNTRKIVVDLEAVREGLGAVTVPAADYYDQCRPLIEETARLVEDLLAAQADSQIEALYITGGGSELPPVARVLREVFGRRVRRSAYTRSATAIGLAIQADAQSGYVLRERFNRYFGVWREADDGTRVVFDPLFLKGSLLPSPGAEPLRIVREYSPVHNIGHFRYLECSQVAGGEPRGDLTAWDEILFPFEPTLSGQTDLSRTSIEHSGAVSSEQIEECYSADAGGSVVVTIRNLTSGYSREYRLGRWASRATAAIPARRRHAAGTSRIP